MSCNIHCSWLVDKKIVINPDGQVWPCCYLANSGYMYTSLDKPKFYSIKEEVGIEEQLVNIEEAAVNTGYQTLFIEYYEKNDQHNIFNSPIDIILKSEWFSKTLPESWTNPERILHQCKIFCSK